MTLKVSKEVIIVAKGSGILRIFLLIELLIFRRWEKLFCLSWVSFSPYLDI